MSNPPFEELFFSRTRDFLDVYLPKQAGRSMHTRKAYKGTLTQFYDYVADVREISPLHFRFADCTYKLVLEFSQYMQEVKHYKPVTVNQKLAAIKSYIKYVSDGDISIVQTYLAVKKVPELSVPKVHRPIINTQDIPVYLDAPPRTRFGNRDRMILILLFDTAIRVSELASITLGDISIGTDNAVILIHGKGRKERTLALSDPSADHLKAYITAYHGNENDPGRPLFFTVIHGKANPMSVRNIERIVSKYGKMAKEICPNMPASIHPHLLRRTRATGLYRDGVPLEMVSTVLGHSNSETTKQYAYASMEQLRKAMQKSDVNANPEEPVWKDKISELKVRFGLN